MNDRAYLVRAIIASVVLLLTLFIISCTSAEEDVAFTTIAEGVRDLTEEEIAQFESEGYIPAGTSQDLV